MKLTDEQRDELAALAKTNDALGHASFQHKLNRDFYTPLADAGFVEIVHPPQGFGRDAFFGVTITDAGRAAISR